MAKFKKGDRVRVVDLGGYGYCGYVAVGDIARVDEDDDCPYCVVEKNGRRLAFKENRLELIPATPEPAFKIGDRVRLISAATHFDVGETGEIVDDRIRDNLVVRFDNHRGRGWSDRDFGEGCNYVPVDHLALIPATTEPAFKVGDQVRVLSNASEGSWGARYHVGETYRVSRVTGSGPVLETPSGDALACSYEVELIQPTAPEPAPAEHPALTLAKAEIQKLPFSRLHRTNDQEDMFFFLQDILAAFGVTYRQKPVVPAPVEYEFVEIGK